MRIHLTPIRDDNQHEVYKDGEVFTFKFLTTGAPDLVIDMSVITEPNYPDVGPWLGEEPTCIGGWPSGYFHFGTDRISGRIVRDGDGELEFKLIYPVGDGEGWVFPPDLIDPPDGLIPFPERTDSLRAPEPNPEA